MNAHKSFLGVLTLSALCAGCVGSGPNTQQGAVGGAAAGAVAGALIGNNNGSALGGAAIGAAAGGLAGAAIGNSLDHQRGTTYTQADAQTTYTVPQPPPMPAPPREVVTVRPAREAVWVEGYYTYVGGNRYEWVPGHWEVPPPRYSTFVHPRWERRGGNYVYYRGHWR